MLYGTVVCIQIPTKKLLCLVTNIHYFQKAFLKYISRQDSYNIEAKKDNNILFKYIVIYDGSTLILMDGRRHADSNKDSEQLISKKKMVLDN